MKPHLSRQPDGHSGLQAVIAGRRVEAQPEAVEIVVADRPYGTPRCEFAERPQFADTGVDAVPVARLQGDDLADRQVLEVILAQREGEPSLPIWLDRQHGLAWHKGLAQLGHLDKDNGIDGAFNVVLSNAICASSTAACAAATLASASASSSFVGPARAAVSYARFRSRSACALPSCPVASSSNCRLPDPFATNEVARAFCCWARPRPQQ
jgi:hypothetical protein